MYNMEIIYTFEYIAIGVVICGIAYIIYDQTKKVK